MDVWSDRSDNVKGNVNLHFSFFFIYLKIYGGTDRQACIYDIDIKLHDL